MLNTSICEGIYLQKITQLWQNCYGRNDLTCSKYFNGDYPKNENTRKVNIFSILYLLNNLIYLNWVNIIFICKRVWIFEKDVLVQHTNKTEII